MSAININKNNFENEVLNSDKGVTVWVQILLKVNFANP